MKPSVDATKPRQDLAKHTPGPWRSFESGSDGARILPDYGDVRERSKYIAVVNGRETAPDCANARLIAAAPDLFKQLDSLAAALEDGDTIYIEPGSVKA